MYDGIYVRYRDRVVCIIHTMYPKEELVMQMSKVVVSSVDYFIRYMKNYMIVGSCYNEKMDCCVIEVVHRSS